jgi:hypothetical protein
MTCDRLRILCEDRLTEQFLRSWLKLKGLEGRALHFLVSPKGVGSGAAYVQTQYRAEMQLLRSNAFQKNLGALVVIDEDGFSLTNRKRDLDDSLPQRRQSGERVAVLVPTRNIETWIKCLTDGPVNEVTDYSGEFPKDDSDRARVAAADFDRHRLDPKCPLAAMKDATLELTRIGL